MNKNYRFGDYIFVNLNNLLYILGIQEVYLFTKKREGEHIQNVSLENPIKRLYPQKIIHDIQMYRF